MRASEFLLEDYNQELQSALNNLLIGAKGNGAANIDTSDLANQLHRMGFSVDAKSIVPLLQNNPNVTNVTPTDITLSNGQDQTGSDQQDSASKVQDMAMDATDLG